MGLLNTEINGAPRDCRHDGPDQNTCFEGFHSFAANDRAHWRGANRLPNGTERERRVQ